MKKNKTAKEEIAELLIYNIAQACKLFGWDISIKKGDRVKYIIVGQPKEVKRIIKKLEE